MLVRHPLNPLITPEKVNSSRPDFEVIGTFNAGATIFNDEIILLVRVAERPLTEDANVVLCPHLSPDGDVIVQRIPRDHPDYDFSDTRHIANRRTGELLLTSISHLRLARSHDGVNFTIEPQPWLSAQPPHESFGVEDARITRIGDTYYVNYTAVSQYGIATGLVSTRDFRQIERHGIIFPPANRDVTLFPKKIGDMYVCYHRPMPAGFGGMHIWSAKSPDLKHWGQHRLVLEARFDGWEAGRVGGGAPPLRTEHGWLSIYHAADQQDRYCLGAFLAALDGPERVIARSHDPILIPQESYETDGFFGDVVFTCGVVLIDETVYLYYGTADERIALAQAPLNALIASIR